MLTDNHHARDGKSPSYMVCLEDTWRCSEQQQQRRHGPKRYGGAQENRAGTLPQSVVQERSQLLRNRLKRMLVFAHVA